MGHPLLLWISAKIKGVGQECPTHTSQNPHPFDFAQGRLSRKVRETNEVPAATREIPRPAGESAGTSG